MKYTLTLLLVSFTLISATQKINDDFTAEEKKKAATAATASYMTKAEQDVIYYMNLCRINPKKFWTVYVEKGNYVKTFKEKKLDKKPLYLSGLKTRLAEMQPVDALQPDKEMYEAAKCLMKEQEKSGATGHKRTSCKKIHNAECCSYGLSAPEDIVVSLLVDYDTPSLGHREIILNPKYKSVGVSIGNKHPKWKDTAVIDFKK